MSRRTGTGSKKSAPPAVAAGPDIATEPGAVTRFLDRDQRRHTRVERAERCSILAAAVPDPVPCATVNLSAGGVRVELDDPRSEIPDRFVLQWDQDSSSLPCEKVWRRAGEVGARWDLAS